jgi:hypothetical protein
LKIVCYTGTLSDTKFIRDSDQVRIGFVPRKGVNYEYGHVYAQFELRGKHTYVLLNSVKIEE